MQGIYTKIEFPYLNDLRSIADHCSAASAELRIYPKAGTYCKQNYSGLPSTLNLYEIDENNISTGGAIVSSDGQSLQSGSLTYDDMVFPIRNSTSFYWSLNFKRLTFPLQNRNTISESSAGLTFGVSFGERWFERRKIE